MRQKYLLTLFLSVFFGLSIFQLDASTLTDQETSATDGNAKAASKAHSLFQKIKSENSLLNNISDLNFTTALPVGISKTIGNVEYLIAVDSMSFDTTGGKVGLYMSLEVPGSGKRLAFGARDIRFDEKGIKPGSKLMLLTNETIAFGHSTDLTIKGENGGTYVNVDCDGFQGMAIDAELQFGTDLMVPEDDTGKVLTDRFVKASFQASMASWGDLMASISITPFQLTNLPRFGFKVTNATFDYSDLQNPAGIVFPPNYSADETGNTWQGISINEVSVRIPNEFKGKSNAPIVIRGKNMLIDDIGLSGNFSATNLLNLDQGKIANWQFAIDSLAVDLQKNQLAAGALAGKIVVPIIDKKNPLGYRAVIEQSGDYAFQVYITSNLSVSMWAAKMDLYPNSSITVARKDNRLLPSANLNGKITVSPSGNASASFADISFQGLKIQTIAPILSAEAFDLSSPKAEQAMAGFPVSIKNIGLKRSGNQSGLSFDLVVNLVGEGSNGFAADAGLIVWGEMARGTEIATWKFNSLEVTAISIEIDQGAFKLKGSLINYKEDPKFGKGFKGMIDAEFLPGLKVYALAQFGSVNSFRYWYVDASLMLPVGLPVAPGFGLYGFGGGAYYHMKKVIANPYPLSIENKDAPADTSSTAGKSLSGVTYEPDVSVYLGIRASVFVGLMPSSEPFNGKATFEIAFNSNGGVKSIGFEGQGNFMSKMGSSSQSAVSADINILYDFDNSTLHGVVNAYFNVPGVLRGTGPNNLAGQVVMHFEPVEWYVYVGHPDFNKRIGLNIAGLFDINAYLVIGTNIPDMPPPPPQVTEILKLTQAQLDPGITSKGGGFGFGASANFGADLSFLMFYANLHAGIGFDVLLKNYGIDARCEGSSSPVGIKGWYAKGQAYAYLQAKVGIKVDMVFVKGDFVIMDCNAALLLQAHLPNPSWMFGKIAADYDILGGLVSGHMDFEVEMGSKCKITGVNALAGIQVISKCSPTNQEQKVSVFNAPQATFNMPLNKSFDIDVDGTRKSFRVMLNDFKLSQDKRNIAGNLEWNNKNDVVAFNAIDVLPGEKTITLTVSVRFEELVNGNWQTVMNKGVAAGETFTSTFTTGPEPDYILPDNILYSYPIDRQFNFYKNEFSQGYIQLKQGQSKPFKLDPGFKVEGRYSGLDGSKAIFMYSYDSASRRVTYSIPKDLKLGTVYNLKLLKVPSAVAGAVDKNVSDKVSSKSEGTNITNIKTKDIEGSLDILQEKSIYEINMRTSKFSTFLAKVNAMEVSPGWNWSIMTGVDIIGVNVKGEEIFDGHELGNVGDEKLIQLEATETNNWMSNNVKPLVYPKYPMVAGMTLDWAGRLPVETLGVPPVRAVNISQPTDNKVLEDAELGAGVGDVTLSYTSIVYNLVSMGFNDYYNLQTKAAVNALRNSDVNLARILSVPYPNILKGSYGVNMSYVLPGLQKVTSTKLMSIAW